MNDTVDSLYRSMHKIQEQSNTYSRVALDHGSADQTRAMLIESIFEQATGYIEMAIKQLSILERQLY